MNDKQFAQFKAAALVDAIKTIGNGDVVKGRHLVLQLATRRRYARIKHPVFPDNATTTHDVIKEEWEEFSFELKKNARPRAKDEALDVMATLTRFFLDEDIENGQEKHS